MINAISPSAGDDLRSWECFFQVRTKDGLGPFVIRVPEGTRGRLEALARSFDMVWATTWMDEAATLLAPRIGVGEDWPFVEMAAEIRLARAGLEATPTWKLPAIERWAAATDRPVAWIDDALGPDATEWAEDRTCAGSPTLLVQTHPLLGMTDHEVEALLLWRRSLCRRRQPTAGEA